MRFKLTATGLTGRSYVIEMSKMISLAKDISQIRLNMIICSIKKSIYSKNTIISVPESPNLII